MLVQIAKIVFTKVVIAMIVLPIPPSTIIALAIIANPKTNQYLDQRMLAAMNITAKYAKQALQWKIRKMSEAHAWRAAQYVVK